MIWQPEFTDKTLSRKPGAVHCSQICSCTMPLICGLKWHTEFGHLNRGDMLTSEQHRCSNEKKKF
ncbi:hypothetical protein C5K15_31485 [Shigella dysenteriae]|uniref:Uncharacterized protein n=1 Tax=Shigella dysenteriae TaxID=622 RepID=A0A2S8D8U8_SHIDY|nr:hypothetical protein C5K18_19590 [Shigella dysenteriae]PQN89780.1 hypothetical protein C5K15_31485 [Shigella dysenteriae]